MTLKDTYKKFRNADLISDEELNFLIKNLKPVEAGLHEMGERFQFAWRAVYDDLDRLNDCKKARKEK